MAFSKEQWEKAKAYYEAGLTLSKIKDKMGIARNTISQRAKREQWEHGEHTDYIEAKEVIAKKKGTKKEQLINVLDEVADEKTKHILFFQNSALQNQQYSNKAMKEKKDDLTALEAHSRITQRNKETVLGKDKTSEINNVQQSNQKIIKIEYS